VPFPEKKGEAYDNREEFWRRKADEAGWPWSHRKTFLGRLGAHGYAAVTIQEYGSRSNEAIWPARSEASSARFADSASRVGVDQPAVTPGRYRPNDQLLAFLEGL
jgi:hypothetical protein